MEYLFSTFLFVSHVFPIIMIFHKSISPKYRLHENITVLNSLSHQLFDQTTSKMVTGLDDAELDKRHRKTFQRLDDPPEKSSKNSSWNFQINSVTKNPEIFPQISEAVVPSSSFLFNKNQFKKTEPENTITLPSNYFPNTEV